MLCIQRITLTLLLHTGSVFSGFYYKQTNTILFAYFTYFFISIYLLGRFLLFTSKSGKNFNCRTAVVCTNMRICKVLQLLSPTYLVFYFRKYLRNLRLTFTLKWKTDFIKLKSFRAYFTTKISVKGNCFLKMSNLSQLKLFDNLQVRKSNFMKWNSFYSSY